MNVTLQDLINIVARGTNRELTDDTKTITKSEVIDFINYGYQKCVNSLLGANQEFFTRETLADLVASQSTYAQPTDCRRIGRLELAYGTTDDYNRAEKINWSEVDNPEYSFSVAQPFYFVIDRSYRVLPTPTANVTNGIRLYYTENPSDLVELTDVTRLPIGFENVPAQYAISRVFRKLGKDQEANLALNEFEQGRSEMVAQSVQSESDPSFVILRDPLSQ
jgi:hypothetical protein